MSKKFTSNYHRGHTQQNGFTIVELMIATLVFSMILTIIAAGVMSFSKAYYHGVYVSETQNAARNVVDTITQSIQFGSGASTGVQYDNSASKSYFCAGGYAFVFRQFELYRKSDANTVGLYMQPTNHCTSAPAFNAGSGGKQLLGDRMRIISLSLSGVGNIYNINVRMGYGDDDLFPAPMTATMQCNDGAGSEYCAVVSLSATAKERK